MSATISDNRERRKLRAAIEQFRVDNGPFDEIAEAVLRRLTPSDDDGDQSHSVLPAFCAYPPARWGDLIADCVHAARLFDGGPIEWARLVLARAEEAQKAQKILADFITLSGQGWTVVGSDPAPEALRVIQSEIAHARSTAKFIIARHSRKNDPAARRRAALGWIAESVRTAVGRAHVEEVRQLAEAALACGDLSEDMVRKSVGSTMRGRRA